MSNQEMLNECERRELDLLRQLCQEQGEQLVFARHHILYLRGKLGEVPEEMSSAYLSAVETGGEFSLGGENDERFADSLRGAELLAVQYMREEAEGQGEQTFVDFLAAADAARAELGQDVTATMSGYPGSRAEGWTTVAPDKLEELIRGGIGHLEGFNFIESPVVGFDPASRSGDFSCVTLRDSAGKILGTWSIAPGIRAGAGGSAAGNSCGEASCACQHGHDDEELERGKDDIGVWTGSALESCASKRDLYGSWVWAEAVFGPGCVVSETATTTTVDLQDGRFAVFLKA